MSYLTVEFWEIVLDVIGLFLCCTAILYLIKNKIKFNQNYLKKRVKKNPENFNKVLVRLLRQSERAFESISDTIKKERQVLQELIEEGETKREKNQLLEKKPNHVAEHLQKKNIKPTDTGDPLSEPHEEAARMAELGLSVKEISERVKIPKSEIELILKLRRLSHEY